MSLELLVPIENETLVGLSLLPKQIIGKNISIHSEASGLPELKGLVDSISISLNADTAETYDQIVRPLPGLRNGIYDKVQEFIKEAKKYIPEVQATIVTKQEGVDEEKCEEISKNFFDIKYRPRRYNITG